MNLETRYTNGKERESDLLKFRGGPQRWIHNLLGIIIIDSLAVVPSRHCVCMQFIVLKGDRLYRLYYSWQHAKIMKWSYDLCIQKLILFLLHLNKAISTPFSSTPIIPASNFCVIWVFVDKIIMVKQPLLWAPNSVGTSTTCQYVNDSLSTSLPFRCVYHFEMEGTQAVEPTTLHQMRTTKMLLAKAWWQIYLLTLRSPVLTLLCNRDFSPSGYIQPYTLRLFLCVLEGLENWIK